MGVAALIVVCILYLITARDYIKKSDLGMGLAFIAYALANIGFIIDLISKKK